MKKKFAEGTSRPKRDVKAKKKLCCQVNPAWEGMCREHAIKHFMKRHRDMKIKKSTWDGVFEIIT